MHSRRRSERRQRCTSNLNSDVLFGILVVIVVVLLIVWAVRASGSHHRTQQPTQPASPEPPAAVAPKEDPCEIAKLRYARGEIKKKEYEEICDTLKS